MTRSVEPIPKGYHTITPSLTVRGAEKAIDFYKRAFGAEEFFRMPAPDGKGIMHAELKVGDSRFFVADEFPNMESRSPQSLGGATAALHVYVVDADAAFQRAVDAGATVRMPMQDMFWGDRYGRIVDPFGHEWGIATRKEQLTPDEIRERGKTWFAKTADKPQPK
jgi:PhnB protein